MHFFFFLDVIKEKNIQQPPLTAKKSKQHPTDMPANPNSIKYHLCCAKSCRRKAAVMRAADSAVACTAKPLRLLTRLHCFAALSLDHCGQGWDGGMEEEEEASRWLPVPLINIQMEFCS